MNQLTTSYWTDQEKVWNQNSRLGRKTHGTVNTQLLKENLQKFRQKLQKLDPL